MLWFGQQILNPELSCCSGGIINENNLSLRHVVEFPFYLIEKLATRWDLFGCCLTPH